MYSLSKSYSWLFQQSPSDADAARVGRGRNFTSYLPRILYGLVSLLKPTVITLKGGLGRLPNALVAVPWTASSCSLIEPLRVWILEDWIYKTHDGDRH